MLKKAKRLYAKACLSLAARKEEKRLTSMEEDNHPDMRDELEEMLLQIIEQQEEKNRPIPLKSFNGYHVSLCPLLTMDIPEHPMAVCSWDIATNVPDNIIKVNKFLAKQEGTREYAAIMWHEIGHLVDPEMNINRYSSDIDYLTEKEYFADKHACEKGYGPELVKVLSNVIDAPLIEDWPEAKEMLTNRILLITAYEYARGKEEAKQG